MRACPSCGRNNPDDSHFCASCGAALPVRDTHEVRKVVTVLFADVADSTALGEQLDAESLRRVMGQYFETARTCLERHGASVEKFIGDAVMAVFGVPAVHEDDALRAVRAADELRTSIAALNQALETKYAVSLHLRIGVNTGEVVVGTEERLATGDAVNVAARLEQAAGSDEILLGAETVRLVRGAVEVGTVVAMTLKGKADPIPTYLFRRVLEGAPAFERRFDAPMVGRREQLDAVHNVFEQSVADRRCHLVTVLGPPGIGKSRLAREVTTELSDDAVVLSGRCLPYGEGITFWPLREIFAAAEAELDTALAAGAPEEIFFEVRQLVERRARERPLVLVVEDIHWAEPTLLDLIEHLVDWTRDAPLLVLCLARPELLEERPAWIGKSNAVMITLDPLGASETEELIEGLGMSSLEGNVRSRIREIAEGNPLFVEQLVATVAEGGDLDRVPPTIQALLAARLETLSQLERDVLERAAVLGLEFEWGALARLDPTGRRPTGALLSALVRKELIRPDETVEDGFAFRHVLVRDAAYERITKGLRADLHERAADWFDGRREEFDEIVGYHLEQAYRCLSELGRPGERGEELAARAADRLAKSGLRANARGDARSTVNLLDRATALLQRDDLPRLALLPVLGRALREAGQMDRADSVLADAIEQAEALGERGIAADAAVTLADIRFHRPAYTGVGRADVLRQLASAIRIFEDLGDEAGLGRALCLGGKLRFWGGEAGAATGDFERAARHSRGAGDRAEEAESLQGMVATMHRGPMPVDDVLLRLHELRPRAELNRRLWVVLHETRAQLEAMRGDIDAARASISEARISAQENGFQVLLDSHTRPTAGYIELLAGDPEAAEQELRPACEGMERLGELGFLSSVVPMLIDALYGQGLDVEALALTERWHVDRLTVPEDADAQMGWRRVRAKLLARKGDFVEAERLGREAVAIGARTDYLDAHANAAADLGEVLRIAGRPVDSVVASREAIRLYEAKGNLVGIRKALVHVAGSRIAT